ncbi:hypothetical protein EST38_g11952 [Candolleomyces aberdarensis]|uniref:Nephrocystin 3-like N-terminal domain-containing protein n=1 Tax=Candolleomyces aberdarensis TaxID=2316362 RepID=A0A4Q2D560_9AGAR|nr:hypothetical protein EST38_g11952 [Candolleomyces aberdarensis]
MSPFGSIQIDQGVLHTSKALISAPQCCKAYALLRKLQCYAKADTPKECTLPANDYLEHPKELAPPCSSLALPVFYPDSIPRRNASRMAEAPLHFENFSSARSVQLGQQTINLIAVNRYLSNGRANLIRRLNPIFDASHTRDRRKSPPDSACFPGTRKVVIEGITSWADTEIVLSKTPVVHIYWFHGFAGSGKSAVSLEIAKIYAGSGRLLASYFFFRNAGDRSGMNRFAATLAAQMVAAMPTTASFIEAALDAEPGLLTQDVSLAVQLERLVYEPFQAALERGLVLFNGPFLIVVDGLDECEDKQGVADFIDHMLDFFERHPSIPLRFFIASRVEEHIRSRLDNDGVVLGNLDSHSADKDIEMFLEASFQRAADKDRLIKSYIRANGEWPTKPHMNKLIRHIRGSFILASTIFKFIVQPATEEDSSTPMGRLPLALEMNGLDSLYAQTLARSQHLPHFHNIISTVALLRYPLPIVRIADLLGIEAFEVVHVLLNLQAIFHVPGTDEQGNVTLCHTSLRDFLTTECRSGCFFVPPSFHLHLSYYCFASIYEKSNRPSRDYRRRHIHVHWRRFAELDACDLINEVQLFKAQACLSLPVMGLPYHTFLCSLSFYSLSLPNSQISVGLSYLLTECIEQFALAAECPDHRIKLWLETVFPSGFVASYRVKTDQFTEHMFGVFQRNLQRASNAIHANFPEILQRHPRSTGIEREYTIGQDAIFFHFLSGREILGVLEWIVARAQFEWEEMKNPLRPPLKLSVIFRDFQVRFRLDRQMPQNMRWTDDNNSSDDNSAPKSSDPD